MKPKDDVAAVSSGPVKPIVQTGVSSGDVTSMKSKGVAAISSGPVKPIGKGPPVVDDDLNLYDSGIYDGQDVAVKLDWEERHRSEAEIVSLRADFAQEVVVWHKLDHPNVTKGYNYKQRVVH
ncbi:Uncharacterized protein Rs2_08297 [Raphanus sativus]|nr:Uncharacterized protein Rs2_08297 [Raphanus sativus]